MKERIEAKLGCTIEEYIKREQEFLEKYGDSEADWDDPFYKLDYDEIDFYEEYTKNMPAA